jgi:hypothetical protein
MNFSYWGFNQYIIQRALGAKSLREAQKGIVFASFLKVLMPVIVVLPGVAAVLLVPELNRPDEAYPSLMNLMPVGLKGLVFAGLVAAIVSSLGSMTNSIATIFTMDLYAHYRKGRSERHYVMVGRIVGLTALVIAMFTAKPLLGQFDQAFQYIQEFTGFFTPGSRHVLEPHDRQCRTMGGDQLGGALAGPQARLARAAVHGPGRAGLRPLRIDRRGRFADGRQGTASTRGPSR